MADGGQPVAQVAPLPQNAIDCIQVLTVCQANQQERNVFIFRERLDQLDDYAELTSKDVTEMAAKFERRTLADGRISIPAKVIKNLQAFCFWAREKQRSGQALVANDFTPAELVDAKERMLSRAETKQEAPSIKPEKFNANKWNEWSKQAVTYLSHVNGSNFCPLDYVIRPEPAPAPAALALLSERERVLYQYPHTGRHYDEDNKAVYRLLSDLLNGTTGYEWIQAFERSQNGRAAWLSLIEHYEGGEQRERRVAAAKASIKALHYKNESIFSFEDFSRKMLQAFRELQGTEEEITEYKKVTEILDKIEISHPRCEIAKSHVRQNFRADPQSAITYLGKEFAEMFPEATFSRGRGRARGIGAASPYERERSRQRTGDGSGDNSYRAEPVTPQRNSDGTMTLFGIDVTDPFRNFTDEEFSELGARGRYYIHDQRRQATRGDSNNGNTGAAYGGSGRGGGAGRGSSRGGGRFYGGRSGGRGGGRGAGGGRNIHAMYTTTNYAQDDASEITNGDHTQQSRQQPRQISFAGTSNTGRGEGYDAAAGTDNNVGGNSSIAGGGSTVRGSRNGSGFGAGAYNAGQK